ncbi:MAG: aminopeptidase N [Pseudomonadales bacterium]|nr:aminopeptidase N [Pseudomonadales bacterium]
MRENNQPKTIRLADYKAPNYLIDTTDLRFELGDDATLVTADIRFFCNPEVPDAIGKPLELVGVDLELLSLAVDGQLLSNDAYQVEAETLIVHQVPEKFALQIKTKIKPQENTSLEGLYVSKGMYCTQCEAEGFRKITYYLDRPDVMAKFTTTIVADKTRYPILLSNGNPIDAGYSDDGKHWVTWQDPFKKPCYLFALVAGDLAVQEDVFTTCTGRDIKLQIFVESHDLEKVDHAMDSLKRSMKWDEDVYGREYDLDIYMIVAVSHFNMGAMENKGLNIFNTSCVLANEKTTTDAGFTRVEAVIAHEYFHNWSGNRVTCRDWFQLSLKEGFTVFRDQSFSADMGSPTVRRIEDVAMLRTAQFAEDASPMAHPVRPDSYIEINNFYTLTVYEKGSEVVRMIYNLLGPELFRQGSDLYFSRHDGQAVTCDDFVAAMAEVSGIDFSQFKLWYSQAGTPEVIASSDYDSESQTYKITLKQACPKTPGQDEKLPMHIPINVGLLDGTGADMPLQLKGEAVADASSLVLNLREAEQTFEFVGVTEEPVPSLLRGFSAPIKLHQALRNDQLAHLTVHDSDGFNRWSAGQQLAVNAIESAMSALEAGDEVNVSDAFIQVMETVLANTDLDKAMLARMLMLPSEAYLAEQHKPVKVQLIHSAREKVKHILAAKLSSQFKAVYDSIPLSQHYEYNSAAVASRALKNTCLSYLMTDPCTETVNACMTHYEQAGNMTDQLAAFTALVHSTAAVKQDVINAFYLQWQEEALVVDQWFSVQATSPQKDTLERVQSLLQHPAFEITNPNKVRALIGAFCNNNPVNFHRADGKGYEFLADRIIELNKVNPQIASRLSGIMSRWRNYEPALADLMQNQLKRIMMEPLSPDVYEIVSKSLND